MPFSSQDRRLMQQAIRLAAKGQATVTPNPAVGCVIAHADGTVLSAGYHQKAGGPHAEIVALNALHDKGLSASGATAYVTLEPCSHHGRTGPCADALVAAGIAKVVYGMQDPNPIVAGQGIEKMRQAGLLVEGPLLEQEAQNLNRGFIKRMRSGMPFVQLKMATSFDGRTAMASGESQWITGPAARQDVQRLRAKSCAIVTGADTVIADNPALTVRFDGEAENYRQPLRVIVDSRLRAPRDAKIFSEPGLSVTATGAENIVPESKVNNDHARFLAVDSTEEGLSLSSLLSALAQRECNHILIEAGANLAGAFLKQGLVDEVIVYKAPCLMGSAARPMFALPIGAMSEKLPLIIQDVRMLGDDMRIIFNIQPSEG